MENEVQFFTSVYFQDDSHYRRKLIIHTVFGNAFNMLASEWFSDGYIYHMVIEILLQVFGGVAVWAVRFVIKNKSKGVRNGFRFNV